MFCSRCGKESGLKEKRCSACGQKLRGPGVLRALGITVIAGLAIAAAGYFGYQHYQLSELKSRLETAVGTDSGYTETILKVETEAAGMTYAELFTLCDKSIEDRQKLIVELRGLYPKVPYALKDRLIQFLNAENELIRAKRSFYRQKMQLSLAIDRLTQHFDDRPTSIYGWDYYKRQTATLKQDARKESQGMLTSAEAFSAAYGKIVEQEGALAAEMNRAGLRFIASFKKYEKDHLQRVNDSKQTAEEIQKQFPA